jgi:hypothetical protein
VGIFVVMVAFAALSLLAWWFGVDSRDGRDWQRQSVDDRRTTTSWTTDSWTTDS